MTTFLASLSFVATPLMSLSWQLPETSHHSPASPPAAAAPCFCTILTTSRTLAPMASHISRLSMRPEAPMRDPTVTSRALLRAKPSAASAHAEGEGAGHERRVQELLPGELQGAAANEALQLSEGDEGARDGEGADQCRRVHGGEHALGAVQHEVAHGRGDRGEPDEGVEEGHQLGEVGDLGLGAHEGAEGEPDAPVGQGGLRQAATQTNLGHGGGHGPDDPEKPDPVARGGGLDLLEGADAEQAGHRGDEEG